MEFVSYKITQGQYGGPIETEINLPKDLKLIYEDSIIGSGLHNNHNHFIGFINQDDYKDINIEDELYDNNEGWHNILTFQFGNLIGIILNDIKFVSNHPEFYSSSDEIINEFDLNNHYIIHYTDDEYDKEKLDKFFKKEIIISNVEELIVKKGEPYKISKIQSFNGPYSVDLFTITTKNHINPSVKTLSIELETNCNIQQKVESFSMSKDVQEKIVIMKNVNDLFESMKNEVLTNIV